MTKTQVKQDFSHARYLMRLVTQMMNDKTITDYSEPSEFGQVVNELIACASSIAIWQEEQTEKQQQRNGAK